MKSKLHDKINCIWKAIPSSDTVCIYLPLSFSIYFSLSVSISVESVVSRNKSNTQKVSAQLKQTNNHNQHKQNNTFQKKTQFWRRILSSSKVNHGYSWVWIYGDEKIQAHSDLIGMVEHLALTLLSLPTWGKKPSLSWTETMCEWTC